MKHKPIREQVVVVCGASSGIGREAALEFARAGAKVVASSRSQEGLDSLVMQIQQAGGEAVPVVADVSDYGQVKAVANRAIEAFGRIDTWAHFAAAFLYAPFRETTPEEFKRIVDVNLLGSVYAAMAALPHLGRQGGALIEISSIEAEAGAPCQSAYAASKHGMRGFMDVLRMELKHERIPVSVTNIMPSGVNTPSFEHARSKPGEGPKPSLVVYRPGTVVRAVLQAAQYPAGELVIGGAGGLVLLLKRLAPRLADALIAWRTYRSQAKNAGATVPSYSDGENRFQPGDPGRDGDFGGKSHLSSAYGWLQLHPLLRRSLGGALVAGAAGALVWHGAREG
jgi:NAD(P)-dependent dehydrogenase (short-subunit alcohol dehydrogenase family)